MGDTLGDLKSELAARGYDYLQSGRPGRWINRGYSMLCDEFPFDFLKKTITAQAAPVEIADVSAVIYVRDSTSDAYLGELDERFVAQLDPNGDDAGVANGWYLSGDTLYAYPADTAASLTIRYVCVPPELSSDSDEPLVPNRYRNLITDAAVYLALKDNDEYDAASALKSLWDVEVQKMIVRLANRNLQDPQQVA